MVQDLKHTLSRRTLAASWLAGAALTAFGYWMSHDANPNTARFGEDIFILGVVETVLGTAVHWWRWRERDA
jgi:hypothetical protein